MRVLVTGAAGFVGTHTVREFLANGYTVRALDKTPVAEEFRDTVETVYMDMTDHLGMLRAVENCDVIAHLAAIPHPHPMGIDRIFEVNVTGTQALLAAAEAHGVKKVALASTCCTFGIYFALHPFDPEYYPMDEKHPTKPQDLYGLSKVLNEETAAAYTRRSGMATVCLRLTSVVDCSGHSQRRWWKNSLPNDHDRRNDMWTYIDVRDTARAFRLAVENAPEKTSANLIVAARDSFTAHDIRHLVKKHFPALAADVEHFAPHQSLYDTHLAEEHIGFVAKHSWREIPEFAEMQPHFS